jgi:hypothetical protein
MTLGNGPKISLIFFGNLKMIHVSAVEVFGFASAFSAPIKLSF